jgi:hypothetical protein
MSEDGQFWWDGSQWQAVAGDGGGSAGGASSSAPADAGSGGGGAEVGQMSEDGQYRWDGSQWQPAGDGGGSAGAGGEVQLPAEVHDVLANFRDHFPELASLATSNDHDHYMTQVVGISAAPTDDATS